VFLDHANAVAALSPAEFAERFPYMSAGPLGW
jgi:hypothetical protein